MSSAIAPVRIPAWQRLGLKLKSAQATEQTLESAVITESLKRKSIQLSENPPLKKIKKDLKDLSPSTSTDELPTLNIAKKKSVTFTPETKIEDGDSIKQLFSAWVAEQKSQDPSFQLSSSQVFDTTEPLKVTEHIDPTLDEKERKAKRTKTSDDRPKKSKSPRPSKISKATKAPARPFLKYLLQYHESRDTWKFNKNHQNHLLKNVFNVEVIPSDHAHLIYEYARGLQGGVRTRLRDTAFALKVKDQEDGAAGFPETMADRDKKQREYDEAMKEYVATMASLDASKKMGYEEGVLLGLSDVAMAERVAKRMRAEQILVTLGTERDAKEKESATKTPEPKMTYDEDDDSQKRLRMNDGSSQKFVRKRKQRTTAVDDDTSSSGDSSDSESTSSDDDSITPPRRHAQAESSSSSSSSSSSESNGSVDSDSDSDSEEDSDQSDSD